MGMNSRFCIGLSKFQIRFFLFWVFVIMVIPLLGQVPVKEELDSLEKSMMIENKDANEIIQIGNSILNRSASNPQKIRVLFPMAKAYLKLNNTNKSTELLFKAKQIAEEIDDPILRARVYGSIANQYTYLNFHHKSRPYLNQALEQIDRIPEGAEKYTLQAFAYNELGNIEFHEKNYLQASKDYKASLDGFRRTLESGKHIKSHYKRSFYNIGHSYFYMGKPDSAEFFLEKGLKINDNQNPDIKYYFYSALSQVYTEKGEFARAIDTLKAVLIDKNFNDKRLETDINLYLSQNYKALGDLENYIFYNEKYLELIGNITDSQKNGITTAVEAEQNSILSESREQRRLFIFIIIILVAIAVIIFISIFNRKKKEKNIYQSIIQDLEEKIKSNAVKNEDYQNSEDSHIYIPSDVESEILVKLDRFERTEKFINQNLTISMLATNLKTNTTYLSEIINKHKGKNFNSYINELRINYICRKIHTHPEYQNYKISYLAESSGFKSHSTFTTVFKNVTGISPSTFLREARKNKIN